MTTTTGSDGHVFALITGGGTGGHVYPALALAGELVARGHPVPAVHFVGSRRGLEASAVPRAGFSIDLLDTRGIERTLSFRSVQAVFSILWAMIVAVRIVRRAKPRVVVGVGGFASVPCLVAARLLRIPTVVHEANAVPGLANRLAVRLGAVAALGFPCPALRHGTVVGEPVRSEILDVQRAPEMAPRLVLITGGSLGAGRINTAALGLAHRWRARADVSVVHVTGPRNYDECQTRFTSIRHDDDALGYSLVPFADDIATLYGRASIAVTRAGAMTVSELAVVGLPAIVVPLPNCPGDHQSANARMLADAGAAVFIADDELDSDRLGATLEALLDDPGCLESMSVAAASLARRDAAERLADLVEAHACVA